MEQSQDTARKDVYQIITERVIAQLEQGTVPWHKPWSDAGMPLNLITKRPYRGINAFLLGAHGYERNLFLTYKQINDIGGKVKRDEKGHFVVFWKYPEKTEDGEEAHTDEPLSRKAILRYYVVYNIAQCNGIPERYLPELEQRDIKPIVACEQVVEQMPEKPAIQHKEQKAYYDPLRDIVNMPKMKSFENIESYYATLFHELVHSTGHSKRLARKGLIEMSEFGSEPYSEEELVAEMGTCFLLSHCSISQQFEQSAAYIQGWLKRLKNDRRFLFSAARQAQLASDYILNVKADDQQAA